MSRVYLHSNNHENSLNKIMLYLFIPFMIYGFYKNGIKLYVDGYVNLFMMFRPILLIAISIFISFVFSKINKKKIIDFDFLNNIMIAMIAGPSINILLFALLLIILNMANKYLKFNIVPTFMIISILIDLIFKTNSFFNVFESAVEHNYSLFDYILRKGYGGMCNTLLIMSIISFVILNFNMQYKKQIPIMAVSVYYLLSLITTFINGNLDQSLLLNNNVIFAFVFLSSISIYTPYSRGGCYIYGLLLGLLTFVFYFIGIDIGVYIVLLALSVLSPIIDRFIVGKTEKNLIEIL